MTMKWGLSRIARGPRADLVGLLLLMATGIVAAGCGGSTPTSTSTTPVAAATPTPAPTPTPDPLMPTLVSPPDGSVLSTYPRVVTLEWAPPPLAVKYRVEIDLGQPNLPDRWDRIPDTSGYYGTCAGWMAKTSCTTVNFPGAQPGRWRVIAASATGEERASVWRTFRFSV
jgi:hypothetical protein